MCGRYTVLTQTDDSLMLKFLSQSGFMRPMNEIMPTDAAPIILPFPDGKIRARCGFWGFPGPGDKPVINSRCETAAGKKFFSDALINRRCVIPATGFFEWSHGDNRQKYLFKPLADEILYMAGAYNEYGAQKKFVIFTRDADADVLDIHNRMPVLIESRRLRDYLFTPLFYEDVFIYPPVALRRELAI